MTSISRHSFFKTVCLFLCLGTILSCKTKSDLQVASKNFDGEIEQQQNLVFSLTKDVCPDSLLNAWDTTEYISFTPAVHGMFKWNSPNELVFSPSEKFLPGTEYTAKLTRLLLKHSKKQYSISSDEIHFHTAPLRVTATHVSWARGKNVANVMVQMDMEFNYDVNLNEAAARLKLSSNGAAVSTNSSNSGMGKVLSLQFLPVNDKDEVTPLKIDLSKGIPVAGAKYISDKDTAFTIGIPSRYNLSVTSVNAQHNGTDGIVTVSTSQPILENDLKSMISLNPSVPFEVVLNDGGFTITSNKLSASQTYQLNISSKMEGSFGGRMKSDYSEQFTFGKLDPAITFVNSKGMYLSSAGYKNIALNIVNISKVEVTVVKVYENNIEHFINGNRHDRYYGEYDEESEDPHTDNINDGNSPLEMSSTDNLGDVVYSEVFETAKLPRQNSSRLLHLDFKDKIKDYSGVYVLFVNSKDQYWVKHSKVISISDVGLIAKQDDDKIYVFANSIKSAKPLEGVKISFIGNNNQKIFTGTTDANGVTVYEGNNSLPSGFNVSLITAKMNDEFSFVMLNRAKIGTSRFDVGGRSPSSSGLIAMIYPERNLYRPGETIHVSTIVRDEQWAAQSDVPVKIKLTMPNGKEFSTIRKILNEEGSCDASFSPPPTAMTGTYTVSVYSGNDVLLNTYEISVEEFMPDRMKVSLKLNKEDYDMGDEIEASVQADNLFGTPAADRNYQCEINMHKETFYSEKFSDYSFYTTNEFKFETDMREDKTDEKGSATESFQVTKEMTTAGVLSGNIMATVFDETGRPVHRYAGFKIHTQPVYVGIKNNDHYVSSRRPIDIGLIALNKNSVPQTQDVEVQTIRKEWHSVIQQNGGTYRYVSQMEEHVLSRQRMRVSGTSTHFMFTPTVSGDYEVRVIMDSIHPYVSHTFYAYGWDNTEYTSFEVDNEGNVDMKTDKKEYNVGDPVKVLLTTPFDGRMLVTVERNNVMKYYFVDTKDKSAAVTFTAEEAHLPNIYVSATLFRPMDGSDLPLTVAHGYKNIVVSNKNYKMPVTITSVEKSRSKTKQTINVKAAPGSLVTIAAVDEGILQVKNFETPDAYDFFYQKVALQVNSYDIYPWLMPEIKTTLSSTGGDGADKSAMRTNPNFVNRVKNVSFWSGILQADASGNVRYDIDIPQFSGDLRIMAMAYKGKAFGSADKHMKVADPIVISTALPRFLSPKDEVVMPVSMSNTTNKPTSAVVTVKVTGQLGVNGAQSQTIQIPANHEQRAVFHISAQPSIGSGTVTVTVRAFGESFVNETEMSVRPPASLQKITGNGFADQSTTAPLPTKNVFIPASVTGRLVIGKSPLTQFSKNLDDLVRYPYGCVEQTTSAAFPQLYFADLIKSMNIHEIKDMNSAYYVQQAINKLQSMQQYDGGLSYWPGGDYESWWGSIYACHFLMEAKKAGYQVNDNTLSKLEDYMTYKLIKKETFTFFFNGTQKKEVAPEEVPYSLYVLALAGHSQQASMNYYKAHMEQLTLDGKYLLAAAYALSGQPSQAKDVLPASFTGEIPNKSFSGSFYSYIRDEALSLNVLMDIDPNNRQVGIMAKQLSDQLAREHYLSTQENVFAMLALGKVARQANKSNATAVVTANGRNIGSSKGENLTVNLKGRANDALALQVRGTGGFYYFWELDGITADGSYKQEDSYIRVRRYYYDRKGNQLSGNNFRQNDLVVVRLTIDAQYNGTIDNVAITDMLPAGFEIENTRLTEMPNMDWIKEESTPDYKDIRDDRINLFTSVGSTQRNFYYMVRAVSPGTYQLGPVQADAMYDGNFHSYNGAGVVRIAEK